MFTTDLLGHMGMPNPHPIVREAQALYGPVLAAIDAELAAPVAAHVGGQLAPVVDPRRSDVFARIRY